MWHRRGHRVNARRIRGRPRGFTIVEALTSIAVMAVLLAILLPVVSTARRSARFVMIQAHQRDVGLVLRQYAYDRNDAFPYYGRPQSLYATFRPDDPTAVDDYWAQPYLWGAYVQTLGYDGFLSMVSPPHYTPPSRGLDPAVGPYTAYSLDILTFTAFATPAYWVRLEEQRIADHLPQRWTIIAFPSRKGVLIRLANRDPQGPWLEEDTVMVCFADGHVEPFRLGALAKPVGMVFGAPDGTPVLTTRGGLLGRDY
jgi:prepilin-type processing-associated H-X9-DG protein